MTTLKKATVKSSTFWINSVFATAGALAVGLGETAHSVDPQAIATATNAAQNATMTITPETIGLVASIIGAPISAPAMGLITIGMAVANQLLRYKTQRKLEKQLDGQ